MRNSILVIFTIAILTATNAGAQMQATIASSLIGATSDGMPLCSQIPAVATAPAGSDAWPVALFYFDETLPVHDWAFPFAVNPYIIVALGERMTAPTPYGFVDSVTILMDSINVDSASIKIVADSLFQTTAGLFHLINIWRPGTVLATAYIQSSATHRGTYVTIPMPHVRVDQEFHIVIGPSISNNVYNVNYYAAAVEPVRARTTENARSTFIAGGVVNGQQQTLSALFDSVFVLTGTTTAAYGDFYAVAYVDTSGTTGVSDQPTSHRPIAISSYPNPTSGETHLRLENQNVSHGASLKIYDALGRMVMDASDRLNNGALSLSMAALSPGVYCARYSEGGKIVRTAMMVRE